MPAGRAMHVGVVGVNVMAHAVLAACVFHTHSIAQAGREAN
jgi:hypothetical protein